MNAKAGLKRALVAVVGASWLAAMAAPSAAAVVSFDFAATQINTGNPEPAAGIAALAFPFAAITGTIGYDTASPVKSFDGPEYTYLTGSLNVDQFQISSGNFKNPIYTVSQHGSVDLRDVFGIASSNLFRGDEPGIYDFFSFVMEDQIHLSLIDSTLPSNLNLFVGRYVTDRLTFFTLGWNGFAPTQFYGVEYYTITSITPHIPPPSGVPEPTSWALVLIGFGGLGATLRCRRRLASRSHGGRGSVGVQD